MYGGVDANVQEQVELVVQQAKRVTRESRMLVQMSAQLRDSITADGGKNERQDSQQDSVG
jgi:DNA-binding ferritin-like protein